MIGAIVGDICGSRFEGIGVKTKKFELMPLHPHQGCTTTDDSIMTLAIADAILRWGKKTDISDLEFKAAYCMQEFGRRYPYAGYGKRFYEWIFSKNPKPYGSFGNGAAMRISPVGFAAESVSEACKMAEAVTKVTHNHPEALKAAEAVAIAIFMARNGSKKDEIKEIIDKNYYRLDFTLDDIRPSYTFHVSCQNSVPQAFEAFFESTDFEDAIRNAISIGGDTDTIAAITGGIAEAYYGVPNDIRKRAYKFLNREQKELLEKFEKIYK